MGKTFKKLVKQSCAQWDQSILVGSSAFMIDFVILTKWSQILSKLASTTEAFLTSESIEDEGPFIFL